MERVISRSRDWQCRFPALSASSQIDGSLSAGRQIVVAVTTARGVRCAFFSNHGSVLDFSATWDELERAKTWWYFVRRWNFWVVSTGAELHALRLDDQQQVCGLSLELAASESSENLRLLALLDASESHARACVDVFASEQPSVDQNSYAAATLTEAV